MVVVYIAVLVAAYISYTYAKLILANLRVQAVAKENGCEKPHDVTGSYLDRWRRLRRMLNVAKSGEDFLDDIIAEDFQKANTISLTAFDGTEMLSTIEPANMQAVLATQFLDFEVGKRRQDAFGPVLGNSIFTSDGSFWEHSRALFRPQFARENINDLETTEKASEALISAMGQPGSDGWTKNTAMMELLYNFTLDTATDFLFGEPIDSQTAAMAAKQQNGSIFDQDPVKAQRQAVALEFKNSFHVINDYLVKRIRLQSLYWIGDGFDFRKRIEVMRNFANHYAEKAQGPNTPSEKIRSKKLSLMNSLATQTLDQNEMTSQSLAILLAGRDTTSAMLGWVFVELSLHPETFSKLREIVLREVPEDEDVTFAKLKSCRYLQHVLNETLRLHPTVPLNQRTAVKDTTIPIGGGPDQRASIAIRKGQIVLFSVYLMQRRKDLWGPDAAEFRPERWEQKIPAWYYLPFLGGPRICLGQQFALTEASYLLVKLLREFDTLEPADTAQMSRRKKGLGVTMWPGDEARVRWRKAHA